MIKGSGLFENSLVGIYNAVQDGSDHRKTTLCELVQYI